jgi:hypothetical protein
MSQIFNIVEDTVVIDKLSLTSTTGNVTHMGAINVKGDVTVSALNADTVYAKHIVTENGGLDSVGEWVYTSEIELNGKGFTWAHGPAETKLIYRTGNRLWTNANLDLAETAVFSIGDTPVLTVDSLGGSITNSQLTSVGTLEQLNVSGDVTLAEFAFFNSIYNRVGIGTDEPNASLSILDNNVEIVLGSPVANIAHIGTYTNHDVGIISDNQVRINVKANGEVVIGDAYAKTGVLRVNGTIFADSIQTDNRITRSHPLEFKGNVESSVYGLGITWSGEGDVKELCMASGPDRLWTTENFDLRQDRAYQINGVSVLNTNTLGAGVTNSSLTTLGELTSLTVAGDAQFNGVTTINHANIDSVAFGNITLNSAGIYTASNITVAAHGARVMYADAAQISIGDNMRREKPVKVFGPLSVGINNPDPSVNFSVNGDVSLGGKKFTSGIAAPTTGTFNIGDICWNNRPQANSYVGWICVVSGDPGEWMPFGSINVQ